VTVRVAQQHAAGDRCSRVFMTSENAGKDCESASHNICNFCQLGVQSEHYVPCFKASSRKIVAHLEAI
jgi:hypothetical protein